MPSKTSKTKKVKAKKPWYKSLMSSQRLLFVLVFAAVGSLVIWHSFAASNNGGKKASGSVGPLALVSQSAGNANGHPDGCLSEDSYDERSYYGYLNGNYSTTEQLCNDIFYNNVYWDSGGIGLEADVYVVGTLTDLTITAPTGQVHHAVLMGTTTSKGVTTNHYAACFVPPYSISTDGGGTALSMSNPGNPWTYTLSGNISKATYYTNALMTDAPFQQANCPASEQNLVQ